MRFFKKQTTADAKDTQTINRYVYVKNNPTNYVDPSGEYPDPTDAACALAGPGAPACLGIKEAAEILLTIWFLNQIKETAEISSSSTSSEGSAGSSGGEPAGPPDPYKPFLKVFPALAKKFADHASDMGITDPAKYVESAQRTIEIGTGAGKVIQYYYNNLKQYPRIGFFDFDNSLFTVTDPDGTIITHYLVDRMPIDKYFDYINSFDIW